MQTVHGSNVADILWSDISWLTLIEDGTRNKNYRGNSNSNIGNIGCVKDGRVQDSLLTVATTKSV